ncbi:MAG TPA: ABC transporter ATP-binding protein [Negativicutes bacterium]|nr:ABC transporter ATP-binding protein [Negativicutes bacterium]
MTQPLVQMRGIVKKFPGVMANDHVDLDIYAGEIHALLGENGSGKSTVMSVLAGLYKPDAGEILIDGVPFCFGSPREAIAAGVGMVHQHFKLVEPFTVSQNMQLGERQGSFLLSDAGIRNEIKKFEKCFGLAIDPDAPVWQLSVGEKQRVEIVRMLYRGSRVLIMDEPTAVLTPQEATELFVNMKKMAAAGCAVVFITHKMNEVQEVADRVTILRSGKVSGSMLCRNVHAQELVWLMLGREIVMNADRCAHGECGAEVVRMENVNAQNASGRVGLNEASLSLHAGQIFGIAGVAGNGQKDLAEVLAGLRTVTSGTVEYLGEVVTNLSPAELIRRGISYVPEDRLGMGLVPGLDAVENMLLKSYKKPEFSGHGLINRQAAETWTADIVRQYNIKLAGLTQPVRSMSGGNLQKLLLAREIAGCPKLIVVVYPARGLDVGATESIHKLLMELRDQGAAILLISEDLDELMKLSDRVGVMFGGRIVGNFAIEEVDLEEVGLLMMGMCRTREERIHGDGR